MDVTAWRSQLRKGAAELVTLALLEPGERYGLDILQALNAAAEGRNEDEVLSEGALYPLLNRLERDGKLASRWALDDRQTRPRKYYALTSDGRALLAEMRSRWIAFRTVISSLVEP